MGASGIGPPVSEEELHGFVDGVLDRGRSKAVEAFLAASPADAARVQSWRRQNEMIRAAFAALDTARPAWPSPKTLAAPGTGAGEAGGRSRSWRERWFLLLIGLAFAGGGLLMAGVDYFAGRPAALDSGPLHASSGPAATVDAAFAARAMAALKGFDPPAGGAGGLAAKEGGGEQDEAAPVLPNLPAEGLKLTAVRVVPGERGKMLCMFYTKQDAGDLALCAEKSPGPSETLARFSGTFPMHMISWRQKGANYALAGEIPELELRALAEFVHAEVEAFDGK